jgi:hypothetical protein
MDLLVQANLLQDIPRDDVDAEYDRRRLDELDDHRLVEAVASVIGVPRDRYTAGEDSFVLHAPLELLARAALLPYVAPDARTGARRRIVAIAARYEAAGPPVGVPRSASFGSTDAAGGALMDAVARGELDDVDAIAAWLGRRARPDELARLLGDAVLPLLGAAGHANIYLALLTRTQPRGLGDSMLRHPVRELAKEPGRHIALPPFRTAERDDWTVASLLEALARVAPIGPPDPLFIAPIVERAQSGGAFDAFLGDDGSFAAPRATPFGLLRFAAQTMLQGPPVHVPFGWTHCLTLAQAPLLLSGVDRARATFVATAYLASHWADLGSDRMDLAFQPGPSPLELDEALVVSPGAAAAAAWHAPSASAVASTLATRALLNRDAHRVKYTLACFDAVATDPGHAPLYLAAAAYLSAWWDTAPGDTREFTGSA